MKGAKKPSIFCLTKLRVFLVSLSFAYLAKTMSGAYMNSMLTQIERRFNIPASLVGVINGSFEMGNLLVIPFVSYLGSKLHRPRIIAVGCIVMGLGCFLIGLPHFLMGRYRYENSLSVSENSSTIAVCLANHSQFSMATEQPSEECRKQAGSLMWVFVLVGNIIRGVGETPIAPLGISYVEDFARTENSPFYIGKPEKNTHPRYCVLDLKIKPSTYIHLGHKHGRHFRHKDGALDSRSFPQRILEAVVCQTSPRATVSRGAESIPLPRGLWKLYLCVENRTA